MNVDSCFQATAEIARAAGDIALAHYRRDLQIDHKRDGSPVTVADRSAEQTARDMVARLFPDDGFLGEEFAPVRPEARRRWIVDPIDGTRSFVLGVPLWGTLVAVAEGDTVIAGSVFLPAVGDMVSAALGEGCWLNGARCSVSDVAVIESATALTSQLPFGGTPHQEAGWKSLETAVQMGRTWGDCFGYLMVATGRAEIMADPVVSPWDIAALFPIVTEAGGVFTDWGGNPTAFGGSAIATNALLAVDCRRILGSPAGQ